jgi:arabinofuranosyltransferase
MHAEYFNGGHGIESILSLNSHIANESNDWDEVGRVLGKLFSGASPPVVIGTTAAGAIPYYSNLHTIDMWGLNDKWIAKNGIVRARMPGHVRYATLQYLLDSKVNIVLGHPKVLAKSTTSTTSLGAFLLGQIDFSLLPAAAKTIEIPLNDNYRVEAIYLCQHKFIDDTIERLGLVTHKITSDP